MSELELDPTTAPVEPAADAAPVEPAAETAPVEPEAEAAPADPGPNLAWADDVGPTPVGFGGDAEPLVLDWFGPGSRDLLVTATGGPLCRRTRVFRRLSGAGDAPPHYDAGTDVAALDGLHAVGPLPNGSDSRFDLVALGPDGLVLLRNQGGPESPAFGPRAGLGLGPDLGLGPCRVVQMVAVDWDGDGLTDLLVGVDDLTGYWPDGDRLPPSQQVGFNQKGGHPGYDRQGLWRGRPPVGKLFWFRNVGRPGSPEFVAQPEIAGDTHPLDLGMHPAPLAVGLQRAGSLELLLTDRRGLIHVYRNFGDQRPPVLMEPRTVTCGGAQFLLPQDRTRLTAADLDGDGRDELLYGDSDGQVFAVHAAGSRGEVHNPRPLLHEGGGLWLGGHAVVAACDLDGDGGLDLVAGLATGRLHLLRDAGGPGAHRYRRPEVVESGGAPFLLDPGPDGMLDGPAGPRLGYACPALADWSGHGRHDLLVGGAGGEVLLLRNDGSRDQPRFGSPARLRCEGQPLLTPPRVRPAAADWKGTGQLDLIALDLQGFLCVYPRAAAAEVSAPIPLVDRLGRVLRLDAGFGLSGRCALWAGPWCGSGHPDILVGLPRANRHVVAALTGTSADAPDTLPTVLLLENLGHGVLCPRPVRHADGRPLVVGDGGCSPSGVPSATGGGLDLLVGADDGTLTLLSRDSLRW